MYFIDKTINKTLKLRSTKENIKNILSSNKIKIKSSTYKGQTNLALIIIIIFLLIIIICLIIYSFLQRSLLFRHY